MRTKLREAEEYQVHLEDELSEAQAQTSALLEEGQRLEEEVNSLTLDREDALLSLSTEQEERATALVSPHPSTLNM